MKLERKVQTILVTDSSSGKRISRVGGGKIGILAAGTSDIGIAEEARLVAKAMGCETILSYDVGIAGIHRVFPAVEEMMSDKVSAIVVVAGMEGALASVVSSMVNIPVIGVPTSVGYGFGSDGVVGPCIYASDLYVWTSRSEYRQWHRWRCFCRVNSYSKG